MSGKTSSHLEVTDLLGFRSGATFSPCQTWRYTLWRIWDEKTPYLLFTMLNPSTADQEANDPTVSRCIQFAQKWGYGGLMVCNIFAYRATDPAVMKAAHDPIGPGNDAAILRAAQHAGMVVCAWGNHGEHLDRSRAVRAMLHDAAIPLYCLAVTQTGEPGHPLYLKGNLRPIKYPYAGLPA